MLALALCASAHGGLYTFNYGVNAAIPDNSIIGLTDAHTISGLNSPITDIQVTLNISGGFNGDLYGYLRLNDSPLVVLVNRVGMTSSNPDGYPNAGMLVTLSSSAAHDIHFYQNFSPVYNSSGQVTGTWQADGRTNPLDTSRGSLSDFNGAGSERHLDAFLCGPLRRRSEHPGRLEPGDHHRARAGNRGPGRLRRPGGRNQAAFLAPQIAPDLPGNLIASRFTRFIGLSASDFGLRISGQALFSLQPART